ncbi:MAG: DUF58 domain-containing protein [Dehalococcoidales bacterium]|jgi:uncharacterized protein (DUF58 family)
MKIRWFLIVVLLLSFFLMLAFGYTMLWRLFIFLVVVLFLSYFWLRLNARNIDGRVENMPKYCRVGEQFEEELTFVNRGRIPIASIEAWQDTDMPGGQGMAEFHLAARGLYTWRIKVSCTRRGEYTLGNIDARVRDPLGFFSINQYFGLGQYIIVFPDTVEVPYFQALPHHEPGANPRRWFAAQTSPNASRVREYASGDSLRYIHWPTTAHTGSLMVKEFDPDRTNYVYKDIWIILDMARSAQFGEGAESTTEYAVTIAASLAKKYLESGKKVGLLASGDRSYLYLPDTGEEQMENVMRALALVKPGGEVPVDALLTAQEERFDSGSAVIVITASDIKRMGTPLRRIVKRGTTVTAILLDAASFGGKVSAVENARGLVTGGVHAYIVRRGADISRALDSRFIASPLQSTGVKDHSER